MDSKQYICGGNTFTYSKGYIGLPVVINNLKETVEVNGALLQRKNEFHISLVCVKDILKQKPDAEQTILDEFCAFIKESDISFVKYIDEFRFAQFEERKSLVVLCEVSGLKNFSQLLSKRLGIEIPHQPTHVTLFTLQPDKGIGLNSSLDLESKCEKVDVPEDLKQALGL